MYQLIAFKVKTNFSFCKPQGEMLNFFVLRCLYYCRECWMLDTWIPLDHFHVKILNS